MVQTQRRTVHLNKTIEIEPHVEMKPNSYFHKKFTSTILAAHCMTTYTISEYVISQLQGSVVRAMDSTFSGPVFKSRPKQDWLTVKVSSPEMDEKFQVPKRDALYNCRFELAGMDD